MAGDLREAPQPYDIVDVFPVNNDDEPLFPDLDTAHLISAAVANRLEVVKRIARSHYDIDAQDRNGCNALIVACMNGHIDVVEWLIESGSDINHVDRKGRDVLLYAVWSGNADVVRTVLTAKGIVNPNEINQNEESRAEINSLYENGYLFLVIAVRHNRLTPEILRLLVNAGCDVNRLIGDVIQGMLMADDPSPFDDNHAELIIRALMECGADINGYDRKGDTPLMAAVRHVHSPAVRVILDAGASVHAKDSNNCTALFRAAARAGNTPDIDIIRMLIEAHSDVNHEGLNDKTPLMMLLMFSKADVDTVRLFLDGGADIHAVDYDEFTVLMHAAIGYGITADVLRFLLDAGCADSINERDANGNSALELAVKFGRMEAVCVLLRVKDIKIDMHMCSQAANSAPVGKRDAANECLREVAAFVIQRHWRECYYNPSYLVCYKRLMEEGEAMEREFAKRLRSE